jgi:hypothetical protein
MRSHGANRLEPWQAVVFVLAIIGLVLVAETLLKTRR